VESIHLLPLKELIAGLLVAFLLGFGVLLLGRGARGKFAVVVAFGFLLTLASSVYTGIRHLETGLQNRSWIWEWALGDRLFSAIPVGLFKEATGLTVTNLVSILAFVFALNYNLFRKNLGSERILAGLAFSVCGVAISWIALTPWLSFVGISIALFGGFLSLSGEISSDPSEADFSTRFGWEHFLALIVAIVGGCIILNTGLVLRWDQMAAIKWPETVRLGAILLLVGVFLLFRSVPFLGWISMSSRTYLPARAMISQIFVGWSAFALILRMDPVFRTLGLFPAFGWLALAIGFLTLLTGVFQVSWQKSLLVWIPASFCFQIAVMAFAGPGAATALMLGMSIGTIGVFMGAEVLLSEGKAKEGSGGSWDKGIWTRLNLFLAAGSATGTLGFVSFRGGIEFLIQIQNNLILTIAGGVFYFVLILSFWRIAWTVILLSKTATVGWVNVLSPLLIVSLSAGVLWSGKMSGSELFIKEDPVFRSVWNVVFQKSFRLDNLWVNNEVTMRAIWIYVASLILAATGAFFMAKRNQSSSNKFLAYFRTGYLLDRVTGIVFSGCIKGFEKINELMDRIIWNDLLAGLSGKALVLCSRGFVFLNIKSHERVDATLRRVISVPVRVLQRIQNGDLQWYLAFAVGSSMAVLLHFIWNR